MCRVLQKKVSAAIWRRAALRSNPRHKQDGFDDAAQRRRSPFRATPKGGARSANNPSAGTNLQKKFLLRFGVEQLSGRTPDINKTGSTTPRSGGDRPSGRPRRGERAARIIPQPAPIYKKSFCCDLASSGSQVEPPT